MVKSKQMRLGVKRPKRRPKQKPLKKQISKDAKKYRAAKSSKSLFSF